MTDRKKKKNGAGKNTYRASLHLRAGILVALFILLASVSIWRLFQLQILRGESYQNDFSMSIRKVRTLKSTRGEIYDCNGKLLAYNKLAYSVTFEDKGTYSSTQERNLTLNSIFYKAIKIIESHGDEIVDNFRISLDADGNFVYNVKGFNLSRFKADIFGYQTIDEMTDEEKNISAEDMIDLMCSGKNYYGIVDPTVTEEELAEYGLPAKFSPVEKLQLCALRSELAANSYQRYNSITIAKDVSEETVSQLLENTGTLSGIDVVEDYKRIYNDAEYFAPIIGYTGQISAEELKSLKEKDESYDSTDIVGKVGLEQVMETSLQGEKGSETIYVDNVGRTISVESRKEPLAGDSLYLTIDSDLQKAAYKILEQYIAGIIWSYTLNIESFNTDWITSADQVMIPVYDVYYSLFENNVLSVSHLSDPEASENEKYVYRAFQQKAGKIFSELKDQLTRDDPTPYKDLTEEMQVYQSYIVDTMLPYSGILNEDAIDKTDLTYRAWSEDGSISLQEFLTYAISKNWIDITGITDDSSYLDSQEMYTALADYIAENLLDDTDFCKRVFRYMLMEGSLSGKEVCLLLFDQGVLDYSSQDYENLSNGSLTAYDFIRDKIYNLEITPAQLALTPCSGAIVITDPNSGAVKACVTYPGYDSNRLVNEMDSDYYRKLATDLSSPFYSRATQEILAPGSTFKLVAATAGVTEGVIGIDEPIYCTGDFDQVTPDIKCWVYPGAHGTETLPLAIQNSCNFYFNTIGWRLASVSGTYDDDTGITAIRKYASMYGLDSRSGVEVPESSPILPTSGAVPAAMGQSNQAYTVTQLARYVSTLANEGTCYNLTLIDKVVDSNGNTVKKREKDVHSTVDIPQTTWDAIHTGMRNVVRNHKAFRNYSGVAVAGKTGTAQETTKKPNHALFVGFAPYEDPDMAIAVRVANGYTSANTAAIARDVISYYFKQQDENTLITGHAIQVDDDISRTD